MRAAGRAVESAASAQRPILVVLERWIDRSPVRPFDSARPATAEVQAFLGGGCCFKGPKVRSATGGGMPIWTVPTRLTPTQFWQEARGTVPLLDARDRQGALDDLFMAVDLQRVRLRHDQQLREWDGVGSG